jgi:protein arginine kinase
MIQSILSHPLPPWLSGNGPDSDVVLSTRVRLARNLAHHQFPWRASLFERTQVFEETAAALAACAGCGSYEAVAFGNLDKLQQEFLMEEGLASRELTSGDGDRGIVHDRNSRVGVMVNEEDHLRLVALDAGLRLRELWAELDALDDTVGTHLDYAFDNRAGFLTCRPANAGTGLRVSVLVHLPGLALTRSLDPVLNAASQMGVATKSFFGENSSVAGNLFRLSNGAAAGSSESRLMDNAEAVVQQVIEFERKARERILADARLELTDKICRSWGILCQAKLLTVDEFFNLSSALRFGIECNLFDKCTLADLNRLTLFVLPAHLATCCGKALTPDEAGEARAALVQTFFAGNAQETKLDENG